MIIGRDIEALLNRRANILNDYPDSIVAKYWKKTDKWKDFETLANVVKEYKCEETTVGIISLRLGDKLELDQELCPDEIISEVLKKVEKSNKINWEIVTGFHNIHVFSKNTGRSESEALLKSFDVIKGIFTALKLKRMNVSVSIGTPDDVDSTFVKLCRCSDLIFGGAGGTWRQSINKVRKILNG